jgi:hypothetical protein
MIVQGWQIRKRKSATPECRPTKQAELTTSFDGEPWNSSRSIGALDQVDEFLIRLELVELRGELLHGVDVMH